MRLTTRQLKRRRRGASNDPFTTREACRFDLTVASNEHGVGTLKMVASRRACTQRMKLMRSGSRGGGDFGASPTPPPRQRTVPHEAEPNFRKSGPGQLHKR